MGDVRLLPVTFSELSDLRHEVAVSEDPQERSPQFLVIRYFGVCKHGSMGGVSDEVWKYAGWQRVVQAATSLRSEPLVDALCEAALLPGSGQFPDDFTVVVLESA